jgi:hypothetical protein
MAKPPSAHPLVYRLAVPPGLEDEIQRAEREGGSRRWGLSRKAKHLSLPPVCSALSFMARFGRRSQKGQTDRRTEGRVTVRPAPVCPFLVVESVRVQISWIGRTSLVTTALVREANGENPGGGVSSPPTRTIARNHDCCRCTNAAISMGHTP